MSNKSIVVYLIFGVILGLAGTLAYIMVFHDSVDTVAQAEGESLHGEGWLTEDPPGFPTIDMSKIYRPPDLTPVTPNPDEYYEVIRIRPAVATATAIAEEARRQSRLGRNVGGVNIGVFPSDPGDRFLHFKDGTYVPLPSDVTIALVDKAKIICDGDYCPFFPVFVLKRITTGVTVTVDSAGKLFRDFPSHRRYGKYDASQFTFLETDRGEP